MQLNADQADAIREIFNMGLGRAAATLSELIATRIEMTVPRVTLRLLDDAGDPRASSPDVPDMAVIQDFQGGITGRSALVLPHTSGLRLAQLLSEVAEPVDELDLEMTGILTEVGNIMLNSVLGVLANIIGTHLSYSVPHFHGARPVNLLLTHATPDPRAVLVVDADFWVRNDIIHGSILIAMKTREVEAILDAICKVEA
jgi:chemotaxis protein CheC